MKTRRIGDLVLALIGLLALTACILACTSFSPDDKKVLYPAFDPSSGAVGMAIYDREAHRSDMLFLPITRESATNSEVVPGLIRGQWLPSGRSILFCWAGGEGAEDKALDLALMPAKGSAELKLFHVPVLKDASAQLLYPLCVAGDSVFLMIESKEMVRLDLKTGALVHHVFADADRDITLLPAPDGNGVFYLEKEAVFGRLDPQSFSRTPLMTLTNTVAENSFFTYDRQGKMVAFVESSAGTNRLVVLRQGRTVFTRPLSATSGGLAFGNAVFSPKGDRLWATYQEPVGTKTVSYGLMEIPLSDAPVRKLTLIPAAPADKDSNASFFQFGMSHDGKTAAVVSTYLAGGNKPIEPEDYALFFVDLSEPNHKVTKVPLARPPTAPEKK